MVFTSVVTPIATGYKTKVLLLVQSCMDYKQKLHPYTHEYTPIELNSHTHTYTYTQCICTNTTSLQQHTTRIYSNTDTRQ